MKTKNLCLFCPFFIRNPHTQVLLYLLLLHNVALLRHVETVQELLRGRENVSIYGSFDCGDYCQGSRELANSTREKEGGGHGERELITHLTDILVPHFAHLLDISRGLRHVLDRVTRQLQLILLVLARLDLDTGLHDDLAHNLLADEVADLDLVEARLGVLVDVDVDGEMGVHVAHLVLEALGHADDHVVDERAHRAQRGDVLARAMVQLDVDEALLGVGEVDGEMAEVLEELAAGALDGHEARLDDDLDCGRKRVCQRAAPVNSTVALSRAGGFPNAMRAPLVPLRRFLPRRMSQSSYPPTIFNFNSTGTHLNTLSIPLSHPLSERVIELTTLRHVKGLVGMNVLHLETLAGRVCR